MMLNDTTPKHNRASCKIDDVPQRPGWNVAWWISNCITRLLPKNTRGAELNNTKKVGYKLCRCRQPDCPSAGGERFDKKDMVQVGDCATYLFSKKCAKRLEEKRSRRTKRKEVK